MNILSYSMRILSFNFLQNCYILLFFKSTFVKKIESKLIYCNLWNKEIKHFFIRKRNLRTHFRQVIEQNSKFTFLTHLM